MGNSFCLISKLQWTALLWPLLLLLSLSLPLPQNAIALQVMVDPGHGGIDSGTSHLGIKEKDLVLKIADHLKNLLATHPQFIVRMTRDRDQHISLSERVKKAEDAQVDLFISLHANSNPSVRVQGTEFYFQNSLPPDEESLILAEQENQTESISSPPSSPLSGSKEESSSTPESPSKKNDIRAILEDLHRQHRVKSSLKITQLLTLDWPKATIKQAPFYVVSKTSMPSVLVEVGFLSHPEEAKKLSSAKYQREMAQKIYNALVQYKEMMDNIEGQALE